MRYLLILSLLFASYACADEEEEKKDTKEEKILSKEHTLTIGDQTIRYHATTGRLPIHNSEGKESARIFFIAFTKVDAEPERPLTFVFPGGPGGSSGPESICAFGPRRLPLTSEGKPKRPPYSLMDNPQTLLFETDLIYVDPVETGYSRVMEKDDAVIYHTSTGDMVSLSMFISNYLSMFKKWNSPLFLSGCSYGTTRACGVGYILTAFFNIPHMQNA